MQPAFRSLTSSHRAAWLKPEAAEIPHSTAIPADTRMPRVFVPVSVQCSPNWAEPQSIREIQ